MQAAAAHDQALPPVSKPIGKALPPDVRAAACGRVCNPSLWKRDLRPILHAPNFRDVRLRFETAARNRRTGDPTVPFLERALNALILEQSKSKTGFVQRSFKFLAGVGRIGRDTFRRCVRWFQREQLLDVVNVKDREEGEVRYQENVYLLRTAAVDAASAAQESPPAPASVAPTRSAAAESVGATIRRWTRYFGLQPREWGWNQVRGPLRP